MLMEGRRAHPGQCGKPLHWYRARIFSAQHSNGPGNAPNITIRPAKMADRSPMLPGEQPVMHLPHELLPENRSGGRTVEPPHQPHCRVGKDRKSVVEGKGVSVRVDLDRCRISQHKKTR